jgi:hypothetical protein
MLAYPGLRCFADPYDPKGSGPQGGGQSVSVGDRSGTSAKLWEPPTLSDDRWWAHAQLHPCSRSSRRFAYVFPKKRLRSIANHRGSAAPEPGGSIGSATASVAGNRMKRTFHPGPSVSPSIGKVNTNARAPRSAAARPTGHAARFPAVPRLAPATDLPTFFSSEYS